MDVHIQRHKRTKSEPSSDMHSQTTADVEEEPPSRASAAGSFLALVGRTANTPKRRCGKVCAETTLQRRKFRQTYYPDINDRQWNDWRWQVANRIHTLPQLTRILTLDSVESAAMAGTAPKLPLAITPYYMSLLAGHDPDYPLRRTVVPTEHEFVESPGEADDPLCEESQSPVPGLVHRYPDRVLFLTLDFCSTYCRYCTRSRVVGHGRLFFNRRRLEKALDYIRSTTDCPGCAAFGRRSAHTGGRPARLAAHQAPGNRAR